MGLWMGKSPSSTAGLEGFVASGRIATFLLVVFLIAVNKHPRIATEGKQACFDPRFRAYSPPWWREQLESVAAGM